MAAKPEQVARVQLANLLRSTCIALKPENLYLPSLA